MGRIDYLGMAVFVASTTLLLYGITTGGTSSPWKSASVLAPLIIGFSGLSVFVLVEWKTAKAPMVPLRIFSNQTANAGYFGAFIHGLVLWSFAYYLIIFVCRSSLHDRSKLMFKSFSAHIAMHCSSPQRRRSQAGK
jgi:hypothetical protein